ncbi:MAG: peptidyl-prolyl cis-trans isomerase [Solirubrobacterales bacterium]|nr:peptidyl-prolyl cis-trans isomerase [Solirubrobacterales bacterium]
MKRSIATLLVLLAGVGASSCAGGMRSADPASPVAVHDVAVRVGGKTIAAPSVAHWTAVIARGATLPSAVAQSGQTPRERALGFLMWSAWVTGEVGTHGAPVSEASIKKALRTQEASFPSKAEFASFLKTSGETTADARLEIKTELAAAALSQIAEGGNVSLAPTEARDYYEHHKSQFTIDEERYFEIINELSLTVAQQLKREAQQKHAFSRPALQESLTRSHWLHTEPAKRAIEGAIFAAKAHAVGGPIEFLGHHYSVFLMTSIIPSKLRPFAAVRGEIEHQLTTEKRKRAFTAFANAWVARWKARSDCRPGYVVEMCRQYPAVPDLEAALHNAGSVAEASLDMPGGH